MSVKYTLHPVERDAPEVEANLPPVWVIGAEDGGVTDYMFIGEEDIEPLRDLLARFLNTGEHDGEISHYEVSGRWLTIGEAVELAATRLETLDPRRIRYAAEHGHIDGARRTGRDWLLPQSSFLGWLSDRPKPGPKPKE